jgi:hypothetical protein
MTRSNSFFDHTGGPQIVERLLKGVSDAKVAGMLVRAWVEEKFGADSKEYAQVNGLLKKQENYNRDSTEYFQAVEDELTGNSVIGIRTLRHMEEVYAKREQQQANLAERIRVAKEAGNIVSFTDYKQMKALKVEEDEPKGAA